MTAPLAQGQDDRREAAAELSRRIFDARRCLPEGLATDKAMLLHLAQLPDQNLVAHARRKALQLGEPLRLLEQMIEDDDLPAARDHLQCAFRRQFGQAFHWMCHGRRSEGHEQIGAYAAAVLSSYSSRDKSQSREDTCDRFSSAALAVRMFLISSRSRRQPPAAVRSWSAFAPSASILPRP